MDEEMFQLFLSYHFATCEREDLSGVTSHALDIFQKGPGNFFPEYLQKRQQE